LCATFIEICTKPGNLEKTFCYFLLLTPFWGIGQIKLSIDTSKLIKGNGAAHILGTNGKKYGFATFKDYKINGKYYQIDTLEEYALTGSVRYDSTCLNYSPGFKIKFQTDSNVITMNVDSSLFNLIVLNQKERILSSEATLIPENYPGIQPELNIGFGDASVVPVGKWERLNLKKKYLFVQFEFDDCGNILYQKYFNSDGSTLNEYKFDAKLKRKRYWW